VRDGQVLFKKGYGLASLEHRAPITSSTVFDIASLSKQVTGLGIALLAEQGRLKLDDDIRVYIPEMTAFDAPITIRQLLHHTSGLRDWGSTLSLAGADTDDLILSDRILTFAYAQRTLNFKPGSDYAYSNTGYVLLGEVIRRVTDTSFRAWTDETFFRPLGMTATHFRDDVYEVIPNRAFGYSRRPDGQYRALPNILSVAGAGTIFGTVEDMAKWAINLDDARRRWPCRGRASPCPTAIAFPMPSVSGTAPIAVSRRSAIPVEIKGSDRTCSMSRRRNSPSS